MRVLGKRALGALLVASCAACAGNDERRRTMRLYKNGVLTEETATDDAVIPFGNAGFVLGYHTPTSDRYFEGAMDELVLWNDRALDDDAIAELYRLGLSAPPIRPAAQARR
jgi:hypothetical protein